MEEKKKIKINLNVAVAVVTVIIFLIMGYYIFSISKSKRELQVEKEQMQDKVNDLENHVSEYQNKIDTVMNVISNDTGSGNTNNTRETNTTNNSTISKKEADKILKEKFEILQKIYFQDGSIFKIDTKETEQGAKIYNYEEVINTNLSKNMINKVKENAPAGIHYYNGQYYLIGWGGFFPYDGLKGFENIDIKSNAITADVVTKQTDPEGNTLPNLITSIKLVKEKNSWLIDSFDAEKVFYGETEQEDIDLQKYVGQWYESKEHALSLNQNLNPNSLNIKSANGNQIVFYLYFTRTADFDNVTVSIENNSGRFEATTDNGLSSDGSTAKINGYIELNDNNIKLKIEKSNVQYLDAGKEVVFSYKE